MDELSIMDLEEVHLAIWNERNRAKRDGLIEQVYSTTIRMYDPNSILNGTNEVSDFIDKVQSDPLFDFKATKPMERTQNGARLFWSIATEQGLLTGMDFFILEDGKVAHLYVFIEG
jgi:hypothetical protein